MKKGIHPKYYPNAKIVVNGEEVLVTGSTKPELRLEVWSGNGASPMGEGRYHMSRYGANARRGFRARWRARGRLTDAPSLLKFSPGYGGSFQARMSTVDGHPYKVEVGGSNPSVPTTCAPV